MVSVHFVCLSSDKGGALPHKDGNLSVGSDFISFLQDVFEGKEVNGILSVPLLEDEGATLYTCPTINDYDEVVAHDVTQKQKPYREFKHPRQLKSLSAR